VATPSYVLKRALVSRVFKRDSIIVLFKPIYREVVIKRAGVLRVFTRPIRPG
jgi:hypothetical protein